MSELRTKLNELLTEVESFIQDVSGRINTTLDTIESLAPMLVKELDIFTPEIKSIQTEIGSQIDKVKVDLDEVIQDTK